jgi:hypothetical protein
LSDQQDAYAISGIQLSKKKLEHTGIPVKMLMYVDELWGGRLR